jgi:Putative homoserine kinase type II (protein kinase fold)
MQTKFSSVNISRARPIMILKDKEFFGSGERHADLGDAMNSLTKNDVPDALVASMTRRAFDEQPLKIEKLQNGCFNAVYRVTLPYGAVILKVAPKDGVKLLRYEKNLMAAEVSAMEKVSQFRFIPAPHILFYDRSRRLLAGEYLFMECMPGVPFSEVCGDLPGEQRSELFMQAGIYARKINSISSDFFGSLSLPKKRYDCWSRGFYCLMDDLLCDAEDIRLELPIAPDRIRRRIKNEAQLLDNVKKPALVHKDLWIGNILVDTRNTEITGIIDFERAMYGDALMEPSCGMLDDDESFVCSFLSGGRFSAEQLLRMALYRIYISLVMLIECPYRSYEDDSSKNFAQEYLARGLREYKELRGEPF